MHYVTLNHNFIYGTLDTMPKFEHYFDNVKNDDDEYNQVKKFIDE
jgi:hypothetical protein